MFCRPKCRQAECTAERDADELAGRQRYQRRGGGRCTRPDRDRHKVIFDDKDKPDAVKNHLAE